MTEIEKLKFQMSIEDIKQHIKYALAEHSEEYYIGDWTSELVKCTSCKNIAGWGEAISHAPDCDYIKQEKSKKLLKEWAE